MYPYFCCLFIFFSLFFNFSNQPRPHWLMSVCLQSEHLPANKVFVRKCSKIPFLHSKEIERVSYFSNMHSTLYNLSQDLLWEEEGIKISYFKSHCFHFDKPEHTNILSLNEEYLEVLMILWLCLYIFLAAFCQAEKIDRNDINI